MAESVLQNENERISWSEDMVSNDHNKLVEMHSNLQKFVSCFPWKYFFDET